MLRAQCLIAKMACAALVGRSCFRRSSSTRSEADVATLVAEECGGVAVMRSADEFRFCGVVIMVSPSLGSFRRHNKTAAHLRNS